LNQINIRKQVSEYLEIDYNEHINEQGGNGMKKMTMQTVQTYKGGTRS
jgi:hypothetical protein